MTGLTASPNSLIVNVGSISVLRAEINVVESARRAAFAPDVVERHGGAQLHPIGHTNAGAKHRHVDLTHSRQPPVADADADISLTGRSGARVVEPRAELSKRDD